MAEWTQTITTGKTDCLENCGKPGVCSFCRMYLYSNKKEPNDNSKNPNAYCCSSGNLFNNNCPDSAIIVSSSENYACVHSGKILKMFLWRLNYSDMNGFVAKRESLFYRIRENMNFTSSKEECEKENYGSLPLPKSG